LNFYDLHFKNTICAFAISKMYTWNLDPIAFSILGLEVRWYGLVYIFGFFLTSFLGEKILRKTHPNLKKSDFENAIFGIFFAGILGGRLGEFIFYSPATFWENPLEILKIWNGGMSIHGGIIAAVLATAFFAKKTRIPLWNWLDALVIPLAITLIFGRLANFWNGELVGIPTDQSWGVIFPHIDNLLRHPSQLYESAKNLILAVILVEFFRRGCWKFPGFLTTIFLAGYGILRFAIEFVRESDGTIGTISTGQILSAGMVILAFAIAFSQNFWKKK